MYRLACIAMLIGVCVLAGCVFDGRVEPSRVTLDGPVVVPMRLDGGTPVVPVTMHGKGGDASVRGPYWFVVDTGSFVTVVSRRVAGEVGLRTRARYGRIDTGSGAQLMSMPTAHVESLAVGGARFEGFDVLVRDLDHVERTTGAPLDGIIGIPLIRPLLWTIDYPGGTVRIERGGLPEPDDAEVHAFMYAGETPSLTVRVDEVQLQAEIDTGMSSPLELSPEDARRLGDRVVVTGRVRGTRLDGAESSPSGVLNGTVTLGKYGLVMPEVLLGRTTTLGSGAFLPCAFTIDCRNQRVRIVPSSTADRGRTGRGSAGSGDRPPRTGKAAALLGPSGDGSPRPGRLSGSVSDWRWESSAGQSSTRPTPVVVPPDRSGDPPWFASPGITRYARPE